MTRGDRVLLVVLVVCAALSVPLVSWAMPASETVTISGPYGITHVDPSADAVLRIQGRIGIVTVVVRDGDVFCAESECPDEVCVRTGLLAAGKAIVCAPNGVVVAWTRSEGEALDAISR